MHAITPGETSVRDSFNTDAVFLMKSIKMRIQSTEITSEIFRDHLNTTGRLTIDRSWLKLRTRFNNWSNGISES